MILLPLVAVALLSYSDLGRRREDSNSAQDAATHIERVVPLGQLIFNLELEQMLSATGIQLGLASVSPAAARAQLGFDVETMLRDTRAQVDRRLEEIADSDSPLPSAPLGLVARVVNLRAAVDRQTAPIDQVKRDFGAASSALVHVAQSDFDIATTGFAELPDAPALTARYHSTQLLFDLVALQAREMFSYGNFVLPALRTDSDRLVFAAATTQKQALIDQLELRLDDVQRATWTTITSSAAFATVRQTEQSIFVSMGLRDGVSSDQATVAPDFLNASRVVMEQVSSFAGDEARALAATATAAAHDSRQRLELATLQSLA